MDRTPSAITLHINGEKHTLSVDHRTTLLDALRERLDLTGTKKGCDRRRGCRLRAGACDQCRYSSGLSSSGPAGPCASRPKIRSGKWPPMNQVSGWATRCASSFRDRLASSRSISKA
nr:2Fe-2S iron-sulfur cluster-binding protein [Streptomyces sp. NBC_00830]